MRIITILLVLFSISVKAQNITPFVVGNGLQSVLEMGDITLGGYVNNILENNEEVISGLRYNPTGFGVYLVYNKTEPQYTPAIKLGDYFNTKGVYITNNGDIVMLGKLAFNGSIPTFTTIQGALDSLQEGKQHPFLITGDYNLKIRP